MFTPFQPILDFTLFATSGLDRPRPVTCTASSIQRCCVAFHRHSLPVTVDVIGILLFPSCCVRQSCPAMFAEWLKSGRLVEEVGWAVFLGQ